VSLQPANFSDYRRETIVLYLKAGGLVERLPGNALVFLVVGMLISDDVGEFTEQALLAAMDDPSTLQAARTLIKKAKND
jgi:hypothetical protein